MNYREQLIDYYLDFKNENGIMFCKRIDIEPPELTKFKTYERKTFKSESVRKIILGITDVFTPEEVLICFDKVSHDFKDQVYERGKPGKPWWIVNPEAFSLVNLVSRGVNSEDHLIDLRGPKSVRTVNRLVTEGVLKRRNGLLLATVDPCEEVRSTRNPEIL